MIHKKIRYNKEYLLKAFNHSADFVAYEFETLSKVKMMACYIEGIIDKNMFDRDILRYLILNVEKPEDTKKYILSSNVNEIYDIDESIDAIVRGKVVLFVEGIKKGYTVELSKWDKRSVEQPQSEAVVRGPKEGFIEDIAVNKVLLRRRVRNNNLVFEDFYLGKQTRTNVSLAYIKGIVNEDVLKELKERLSRIDVDSILESEYIEEFIEDSPWSLISTISETEKPDITAAKLLEGRIAILTDGTPHVLIVPRILSEGLMSSEDYYVKPHLGSFLRIMRIVSLFITIYLPGVFVSLMLYHQEMIPTVLLISAAGGRAGVPLPITIEVILMIVTLELTKESTLRLPKNVGTTVNIVGALVLGQAAVEAGLISAVTVILVSITALCEFIVPQLTRGIIIYRLLVTLAGGFFGMYGVTCAFIIITTQIISLESFGIPFAWPLAPRDRTGLKDALIRFHIKHLIYRPRAIARKNIKRQNPPKGD